MTRHTSRAASALILAALLAAPSGPTAAAAACDQLTLRFPLVNPEPTVRDLYGYAVAATGNLVVVGAKQDDPGDVHNAGTVYVYNQRTGSIRLTIANPFPNAADHFGDRLAFLGSKVVVGAHYNDRFAKNAGAVYLFSSNTGKLLRTFYSPTPDEEDLFGFAVASLGTDRIIVGAHRDDTVGPDTGAVYVYRSTGGAPILTLHSPTPDQDDLFGISVAAIGTSYILVGAHHDDAAAADAGAAYLFDATTGALVATLTSPSAVAGGRFGWAVASVGATGALVGAFDEGPGAAYLFDAPSGTLRTTFTSPSGQAGSEFGFSVAAVGNDVLIGAPEDGASHEGRAYLFDGDSGSLLWTFETPHTGVESDFGYSVAAAGSHNIAIGAPRDSDPVDQSGYAFLFGGCAQLKGSVYKDLNNNGFRLSEGGISGVPVALTGTDVLGNPVQMRTSTNRSGFYFFGGLVEGDYEVQETQPTLFLDGIDREGTLGGSVVANDRLAVAVARGDSGEKYNFGELPPASLSGFVFLDNNASGALDAGDAGIASVTVTLSGTDDLGAVGRSATTDGNGYYAFSHLRPGTYALSETQPGGLDDGQDTVGTAGGALGNDAISEITLGAGVSGEHYDFGELVIVEPASLCGFVYLDADDDGQREPASGELGIAGVAVALSPGGLTATTGSDGSYCFSSLTPGTYTVTEAQPAGYGDGQDTAGSAGGTVGDDEIADVVLASGVNAVEYNFGERSGGSLDPSNPGYTGTIGYWQNQNGQEIILSFNGGPGATALGHWLATTFPSVYGLGTGPFSMAGKTNEQIAAYYKDLFKNADEPKVDVQFLCGAFGVYATTLSLGGNDTAFGNGFIVGASGTGELTISVGDSGAAFGVPNGTVLSVAQIYEAVNSAAVNGVLYNGDFDLRELANRVLTAINEQGDIPD